MAITAEFIGVYIAGIIITTATITVIGATITAITAIGETSGSSRQQTSSARVAAHAAAFCLFANSLTLDEARHVSEQHRPAIAPIIIAGMAITVPTGMAITDLITDPTIMGMATPTTGPTGGPALAFGSEPGA
jgi:hypothetical protein